MLPIYCAKRSFNWTANPVFGNIGRIASEKYIFQLIKEKCLPIILLYGLKTYPLKNADPRTLPFTGLYRQSSFYEII